MPLPPSRAFLSLNASKKRERTSSEMSAGRRAVTHASEPGRRCGPINWRMRDTRPHSAACQYSVATPHLASLPRSRPPARPRARLPPETSFPQRAHGRSNGNETVETTSASLLLFIGRQTLRCTVQRFSCDCRVSISLSRRLRHRSFIIVPASHPRQIFSPGSNLPSSLSRPPA